jgi:hypothetical protein
MRKGKWYILPLYGYGQPSGDVQEIRLTKAEAESLQKSGQYLFKNYAAALYRAQD